jgi:hypothetical protein
MGRYSDIDPQDIDPDTGRPYAGYSSPSLDTSFHDGEMDVSDSEPFEHLDSEADDLRDFDDDEEQPDLLLRIERLEAALRQWHCDACGGSGEYLNNWIGNDAVTGKPIQCQQLVNCRRCRGGKLHPIAQEALS